jgi:hypothetical protein
VDLILSEGYKRDVQPKIEIFRKEKHQELLCAKEDNLIAIVTDQTFNIGVPCFDLEDMKGLSSFIEKEFLKAGKGKEVSLEVGGKPILLGPFVTDFMTRTIKGMLSALKGYDPAGRIEIRIEGEEK